MPTRFPDEPKSLLNAFTGGAKLDGFLSLLVKRGWFVLLGVVCEPLTPLLEPAVQERSPRHTIDEHPRFGVFGALGQEAGGDARAAEGVTRVELHPSRITRDWTSAPPLDAFEPCR